MQRYEHARAGDLMHLEINKLVRYQEAGPHRSAQSQGHRRPPRYGAGIGSEIVRVAIDDHSRIAFSLMYQREAGFGVALPPCRALAYYARLGIHFWAVLTDNGWAYRSRAFTQACRTLALKHRRTRPYTPRTNGKAERFIQTALREWAYARTHQNSTERDQALGPWLHQYIWHRPHASLGLSSPIARSGLDRNNLLRLHN